MGCTGKETGLAGETSEQQNNVHILAHDFPEHIKNHNWHVNILAIN